MSGYPTVHFGQSESGLFSPEEIARLMESEYHRSLRYGYPLALLLIEIDRLESLHDLYGVDSKRRIAGAVASLLRSSTRASDVLGILRDQRLLVLLPHARSEGALAIARRLLEGCHELEFRSEGRALRATLSIGCAMRTDEDGLARLTERAERALRAASAAGGDRVVDFERLPGVEMPAAPRVAVPPPPPVPARTRGKPAAPPPPQPLPAAHELAGATLEEKVRSLLRLAGGGTNLGALEREVLAILQRAVEEAPRARASRADVIAQMHAVEQRIAHLKRMLDASEEELARMVQEKSADPGVASIYRSVQGLDPRERDYEKKKEMLGVIYRANVELLRQLEEELGSA